MTTEGSAQEDGMDPKLEREIELLENRHGLGEMPQKLIEDFGFMMNRLHDPTNFDHTTLNDMLSTYHARNLEKSKIFRIAKKIFGDKMDPKFKTRTRVFQPVGMETGYTLAPGRDGRHDDDSDEDLVNVADKRLHTKCHQSGPSKIIDEKQKTQDAQKDYRDWITERKELRTGLDNLGLNEQWLQNKPDRTAMEASMLKRMIDKRRPLSPSSSEDDGYEEITEEVDPATVPKIRRPSPLAIRKLERFLKANRLRLIDIFTAIDKNKNWRVSKEEFQKAIQEYEMDISPSLLDDLIATFDSRNDGEIDYRELAIGVNLWKLEKRDSKRRGLNIDDEDAEEDNEFGLSGSRSRGSPDGGTRPGTSKSRVKSGRVKSGMSTASSATTLLEAPEKDLRDEAYVMNSPEAQVDVRKRDKNFLQFRQRIPSSNPSISPILQASRMTSKISVFKTGYKPVDDHCRASTLGIDSSAMVDEFRQLKLKEYHEILRLCEERGVKLSRELLDRNKKETQVQKADKALLHPGDKTGRLIKRQGIRQPGKDAPLSRHFADPPKRPRTPIEIRNRHKMKRGEDGELLIDYKHLYRSQAKCGRKPEKMSLPTGKAYVARKVDCWLTFEEFDRLTKHFYNPRFVKMGETQDPNAHWPGYMLEKMRLVIPGDRTRESTNAIFHEIRNEKKHYHGYDNDLNQWKVSDQGYLLKGSMRHPKKFYDTSNKMPTMEVPLTFPNSFVNKRTENLTMHTKVDH